MANLSRVRFFPFLLASTFVHWSLGGPTFGSILQPIGNAILTIGLGEGLVEGALGGLKGWLGDKQVFDYVVVGGGTGGNAIGVRLAEAGFSVAIVEAGTFYELSKPVLATTPGGAFLGAGTDPRVNIPTVDWGFVTEPQAGLDGRRLHFAQGKCLAGSSALNFMAHHRASTGTYDKWADLVGDDSYRLENWLPFYKKSVTFTKPNMEIRRQNATPTWDPDAFAPEGQGGPVQVTYSNWAWSFSTWLEKGLAAVGLQKTDGFDNGQLLGYHWGQATIRASDQTRSSSVSYVYAAMASDKVKQNLKVFTQTLGKKILFDDSKKATGVRVSLVGSFSDYTITAKKEVIVSSGAFRSPQLLMVSGIGPKDTLDAHRIPVISQLEGVGQNMWDHVMFGPSYEVTVPTLDSTLLNPANLASSLSDYSTKGQGPLASNVIGFLAWEKLPEKYRSTWSESTREAESWFPDDWPELEHLSASAYVGDFGFPLLLQPRNGKDYATDLGAIVAPLSRGNVTIKSADTAQLPRINPNWLTHPADKELAVSIYRRLREVWDTPEMRSIRADGDNEAYPGRQYESDEQILQVIKKSLLTVWHPSCTCKMGKSDDPMAVVDSRARVFGVEGVRVVDASAFALLPEGHPQTTVYALAEKIAHDIISGQS